MVKYDIYESTLKGFDERKLTLPEIKERFSKSEIISMIAEIASEIIKDGLKFWAEEAIDYETGFHAADLLIW